MFNKMSVRTRLLTSFLLVALLGAVVGGIGVFSMANLYALAASSYSHDLLGLSAAKEANINLIYIERATRDVMLSNSAQEKARFNDMADAANKKMRGYIAVARPLFRSAEAKTLFADLDKGLAEYEAGREQLFKLTAGDAPEDEAAAIAFASGPLAKQSRYVDDKLSEINANKETHAAAAAVDAAAAYAKSRSLMLALTLLSVGAGIGLGLWITRILTRQLGGEPSYAVEAAGAIAAGQLSEPIHIADGDQHSLLFAMEAMRQSLVGIVGQVRTGTDMIATASNEIAAGNLDLSSRTEEQASSLEETASSMEELTSTVKQNSDNARQANQLAVSASEVAIQGGSVVAEVVSTMASINDSSKKIVDIIGVIDGIAFQTNILALNAAVEAARAGEQGRGFAVVATEVRNLAQRSAAAAREIKALINDSVEKVDAGGKLVDQAGVTMGNIVQSITRVTDIVAEIASASIEQTAGIEQINAAIAQMDEVTQQNAALVEQAAAAAGSLEEQAAALAGVVSIFNLGQGTVAQAPRRQSQPGRTMPRPAANTPLLAAKPAPPRAALSNSAGQDWEAF